MPTIKIPEHIRDLISLGKSLQEFKIFHRQILKHKITCSWSPQQKLWIFRQTNQSKTIEFKTSTTALIHFINEPTQIIQHFQKMTTISLLSLDVGFDLRATQHLVNLPTIPFICKYARDNQQDEAIIVTQTCLTDADFKALQSDLNSAGYVIK